MVENTENKNSPIRLSPELRRKIDRVLGERQARGQKTTYARLFDEIWEVYARVQDAITKANTPPSSAGSHQPTKDPEIGYSPGTLGTSELSPEVLQDLEAARRILTHPKRSLAEALHHNLREFDDAAKAWQELEAVHDAIEQSAGEFVTPEEFNRLVAGIRRRREEIERASQEAPIRKKRTPKAAS